MINAFILQHKPFTPQIVKNPEAIRYVVIDLFCGAGGTTTGFSQAKDNAGNPIAIIAACVNHDHKAIRSHWENHPEVYHFEEDIRTLELSPLTVIVEKYRELYPWAKIVLWASLECTNFSKAKGGQARDADSRTLADHLDRYITALDPDYVQIENVVEFMSWGPLNEFGKPVSMKSGQDWLRWRNHINSFGYRDEWKELNSADFGAYTSRNRLFGCFAKENLPIVWPEPTHSKTGTGKQDLFGNGLLKWKPVKDLLDFKDEGESIFGRKKPLVENSLKRVYAGLIKEVAGGKEAFLTKYYGNEKGAHSVNTACGTLTTEDRFALHQVCCLDKDTLMTTGFIYNPSHGGHTTSIETGCPTIIARQDKAPLYFIQYQIDQNVRIEIYEDDSETMIKIKEFMAIYGISDIKMRMLKVSELKLIQGFPADYKLYGNQSDQKKFIGNSVVPHVVCAWAEAQGKELLKLAA
ncbi:DNA cytosine methyltransferase [Sphingobacterium sp. InxBP1]|uniref:DNA cytosine methyltransferase n=1 Tax=Sphingobacterium sp. InxBP1 TaxID=2870328 RepID=UPI0022436F0B|nr:DNA cytosine methyltransferase [Sphingobacterium sp. InxBP1]MCW8309635.1 DNA cytosine methyltransferase [Sphingobacterium sp. InxBP1]